MRLIDADALLKVLGFTEDCKECEHRYNDMLCDSAIWRDVCDAIFEAPTIDAVPVVRCKDCKRRRSAEKNGRVYWDGYEHYCGIAHYGVLDDGFCFYGERRRNE